MTAEKENRASIYVHIPFCQRKCSYCDFASFPNRQGDMDFYVQMLLMEAKKARDTYGAFSVSSVFIGGGTPTIMPGRNIANILNALHNLFHVERDAEITIEGNPGTLTRGWLDEAKNAGANRLSFGAQAFQEELLQMLGRIHTRAQIGEAIAMARDAGFDNLNLDLMYALPGQTMDQWRESLEGALALELEHISCYSLIAEQGTPLTARLERGEIILPDEETTLSMQRLAADILESGGLLRYEISNYAKPGFESRHNLGYWRRADYLGLGCAAHSLMRGERFCNSFSLDAYLAGQTSIERETLSAEEEIEEAIMLETRTVAGIDLAAFHERYGVDFEKYCARGIQTLCANGLAVCDGKSFRLTEEGLDVQNAAVLALLE